MSLEAAIAELTAAVNANTESLKAALAGRAALVDAVAKKAITAEEEAPKVVAEDEAEKPRRGRPPKVEKVEKVAKAEKVQSGPSVDEVGDRAIAWMKDSDKTDEVDRRRALLSAFCMEIGATNPATGKPNPKLCPEDKTAELAAWLDEQSNGSDASDDL